MGGYGGDYTVAKPRSFLPCCIISLLFLGWLWGWLTCWGFFYNNCQDMCKDDIMNWQYHWSESRKRMCCAQGKISPQFVGQICATNRGGPVGPTQQPGPVDPFNCADGVLNWQAGWSEQ